jgi:hypothetical protein
MLTITPSSASNKIFILCHVNGVHGTPMVILVTTIFSIIQYLEMLQIFRVMLLVF